jgi:hypothetical protein
VKKWVLLSFLRRLSKIETGVGIYYFYLLSSVLAPTDIFVPITVAALSKTEISSPAQTLGSWVRIPLEAWMSVRDFSVLTCIGRGFATGLISFSGRPINSLYDP